MHPAGRRKVHKVVEQGLSTSLHFLLHRARKVLTAHPSCSAAGDDIVDESLLLMVSDFVYLYVPFALALQQDQAALQHPDHRNVRLKTAQPDLAGSSPAVFGQLC